ncbi:MAG: alanine--tRNA ligase [Legionellales bacterium]|nr:alanine--tRNA ligase [Legionellales bacterium]HBH10703.1 alanine--tRNA ligase [Gammaproteobacteria bacterium]|tara:strand:+ start:56 stop:2662 length:2607 start_codon:yes stop_codon:yes gene_type:complete
MKTSNDIRQSFLDFFKSKDHEIVPSSSLVPANDPTLLFTNAGMVQFKDVFLGRESRPYKRAASSQRCVRAGGKHNDLENVGYTARHHTFFEMLGNFSFGDYFKQDAITYAWEYLTAVLKIPESKLWITVFEDDEEAANIWLKEIGVSSKQFTRCGEKDNFWSAGDTGPCGPCSEIFYDHGEDIPGGPPGSKDADLDRYVEIWNLVFTQFNRGSDGSLTPIPHPSVDTGMGLERVTAVMQGVNNNFEIESFEKIIKKIKTLCGNKKIDLTSSRVVADHIRSCSFLLADGVIPSNEGRGYVLRRIIRRAIRHGNKLGFKKPFFHQLVEVLEEEMGDAYPELSKTRSNIESMLLSEEERFAETLDQGLKILDEVITKTKGDVIHGEDVFRLYDTYGFPVDLTADIAREKNMKVDMKGFNKAMAGQRKRARAASKFDIDVSINTDSNLVSAFTGYERLEQKTTIIGLYQDGRNVKELNEGDVGGVILLETPFYAQSGGQVGDKGELFAGDVFFEVEDTKKQGQSHIHLGILRTGTFKVGDVVRASVDQKIRTDVARNHSATHLLHAALRKMLGDHVVQKGSLVESNRLRFDFSHNESLTYEQLKEIEQLVNSKILENNETQIQVMPLEKAKLSGAISLFGEKYEDTVRVLNIGGEFSCELCGGTHVERSGDIGVFKIISESGIASGVRRIEAITGLEAFVWIENMEAKLQRMAESLKSNVETVDSKLNLQLEKTRKLEKELLQLRGKLASNAGLNLLEETTVIDDISIVAKSIDTADPKSLRDAVDQLKNKLGTAVLILATVNESKVSLVAGVTDDTTNRIKAGDLVNFVAEQVGGRGGGRPDMAQAGGDDPKKLESALAKVPDWVRSQLKN